MDKNSVIVFGGSSYEDLKNLSKKIEELKKGKKSMLIPAPKKPTPLYIRILGNTLAFLFFTTLSLGLIWLIIFLIKSIGRL